MSEQNENLKFKSWKIHFAIIVIAMLFGCIIALTGIIFFGHNTNKLFLIILFPFIFYSTTIILLLFFIFGLGAIGYFIWNIGKWFYKEINTFFNSSKTDHLFYWYEYFKIALTIIIAWFIILIILFIIIAGIKQILLFF